MLIFSVSLSLYTITVFERSMYWNIRCLSGEDVKEESKPKILNSPEIEPDEGDGIKSFPTSNFIVSLMKIVDTIGNVFTVMLKLCCVTSKPYFSNSC